MISLFMRRFKNHDTEVTLNMSLEDFSVVRRAVEERWATYKAKFPDWELGCVPLTITSYFLDDVSPTKIHVMDMYAFYLDVWVKKDNGEYKKLFNSVVRDHKLSKHVP